MTPRNPLDGKVIVDRKLLETVRAILRTIDQCPTTLAMVNQTLAADLTGWAAVPVKLTRPQFDVGLACAGIPVTRIYEDMLATSPPLPGGGE